MLPEGAEGEKMAVKLDGRLEVGDGFLGAGAAAWIWARSFSSAARGSGARQASQASTFLARGSFLMPETLHEFARA